MFEVLVQKNEAVFAGPENSLSYVNRDCIVWKNDPHSHAANIPVCGCCKQPRTLHGWCGGLTYGKVDDENHRRFMSCPFDRYGCSGAGGVERFDCCHCRDINHLMYTRGQAGTPMTVFEIEAEIDRHKTVIEKAGGTPFLQISNSDASV